MVGSSPWLVAATHVLLRLQAPRHPPLALCSLEIQRCSCSLWSSQGTDTRGRPRGAALFVQGEKRRRRRGVAPVPLPQNGTESLRTVTCRPGGRSLLRLKVRTPRGAVPRPVINWESPSGHGGYRSTQASRLLRKEVIQPHLPVRLPCYDFTPIADPTFDSSLPKGWATGFGCYQLSWCDGRCVQGPGTYSPRRC